MSEINYQQILASSKSNLNEENYHESDLFVNLFFSGNCKDIPSILAAYSYQSYNYTKINFSFNLPSLIQNSINYLPKVLQDTDTAYCLVKILYRLSNFLFREQKNLYHSIYLVDKCNFLFEKTFLKKTQAESYSVLQDLEGEIRKEIFQHIKNCEKVLKESEKVDLLRKICNNVVSSNYVADKITQIINSKEKSSFNNDNDNVNNDNSNNVSTKMTESNSSVNNNAMNEFNDRNMLINTDSSNNVTDNLDINKNNSNQNDNELFYLVSTTYIKRLCNYLQNSNLFDQNLLDLDNVLKEYINSNIKNDNNNENIITNYNNAVFPGPIDNLDLIDFKASWDIFLDKQNYYNSSRYLFDHDNKKQINNNNNNNNNNSNVDLLNILKERVVLKPNLKEKEDFLYILKNDYLLIKQVFDANYDIPRYYKPKYQEIECYYHNIDFLMLSPKFRKSVYSNLLCVKNTQISKDCNFESFVERIKVIYLTTLGGDYLTAGLEVISTIPVKLFLVEKRSIDLFEMSMFFIKNQDNYNVNECQAFNEDFYNEMIFQKPGSAYSDVCLIVEFEGIDFISNDNNKSAKKVCAYCNNNFDSVKVKCSDCNQAFYCKQNCKVSDLRHQSYHKSISAYYKKEFDLANLLSTSLDSLLVTGRSRGRTGLRNLGNTCFMNSAIQCLSHCDGLTKYFLMKLFEQELNYSNKLGSGGEVAKGYYGLINELWNGTSPYLNPGDFRYIFIKFARQFSGFSQHDSHEMLAFVLDGLHEDLNRIRTKPYSSVEEQDTTKETDLEASERWWKNHLARENSIIVDLFHGQYKTKISCPDCKRQCLNYDSFMYLSLPIPSESLKISIKVINFNKKTIECTKKLFEISTKQIYIHETITAKELLSKFAKSDEMSELILVNSNSKAFKRIVFSSERLLSVISKENEAVIYIIDSQKDENSLKQGSRFVSFYYNIVTFYDERTLFSVNKCIDVLDYPYVVLLQDQNTMLDLYEKIYYQNQYLLNPISITGVNVNRSNISNNNSNINNKQFSTFIEYFSRLKLYIINNLPEISGFLSTSRSVCEFCNDKCNYCALNVKPDSYLSNSSSHNSNQKSNSEFIENMLSVNLTNDFNNNNTNFNSNNNSNNNNNSTELYESTKISMLLSKCSNKRSKLGFYLSLKEVNPNIFAKTYPKVYMNESYKNQLHKSSNIDITDCLELFRLEEKLEQDNCWYCNVCKKHQEATVKMQIYRPPVYLIVHLKRFKAKDGNKLLGFMSNRKNENLVNYPLELDLSDFVLGNYPSKYELFAINQHYGSLSGGHYTAICKNQDLWLEFDDDSVKKASSRDIVTNAAYLLFYKLKV